MRVEPDPDAAWVEALSACAPSAVAEALAEAQGERRLFLHLAREHARAGRESYVEIDAPLELHALVRLVRPAHVLEVGVSSGVSSAYLLNALEKNHAGTLHSIDLPARPRRARRARKGPRVSWSLPPGKASGWAVPPALRKRWDLRIGDKAEVLPVLLEGLPRVEMVVYDVPHRDIVIRKEFERLDPLVPAGGIVIVDHGPGGELCSALEGLADEWASAPVGRAGLGLYGARRPAPVPVGTRVAKALLA